MRGTVTNFEDILYPSCWFCDLVPSAPYCLYRPLSIDPFMCIMHNPKESQNSNQARDEYRRYRHRHSRLIVILNDFRRHGMCMLPDHPGHGNTPRGLRVGAAWGAGAKSPANAHGGPRPRAPVRGPDSCTRGRRKCASGPFSETAARPRRAPPPQPNSPGRESLAHSARAGGSGWRPPMSPSGCTWWGYLGILTDYCG